MALAQPPDVSALDLVAPLLAGFAFIAGISRLREPARRELNAILAAGASAAYLGGGLGVWELPFLLCGAALSYWGLRSYRALGIAWFLHVGWDLVHHFYADPIWPFMPTSSAGCAVFDAVIGVWLVLGAPPVHLSSRVSGSTAALVGLALAGTSVAACSFVRTHARAYGACELVGDRAWPPRLSETGLYANLESERLADGVEPFEPLFSLWSDGATKRRWVRLPAGAVIDSADMDTWRFPVGTRFWKEFTRDGIRVETRLLEKVGAGDDAWRAIAYVWNEAGSEAFAAPEGATDARGTAHDVPSAAECMACHAGKRSRVLGFSAVQLSRQSERGGVDLEGLIRSGRLSRVPSVPLALPGDALTQRALGYLHANCSHCHNLRRPRESVPACYDPAQDFDFSLWTDELASVSSTATLRTAAGRVLVPGDGERSMMIRRFGKASPFRPAMPPLGVEIRDVEARALLVRWIDGLAH